MSVFSSVAALEEAFPNHFAAPVEFREETTLALDPARKAALPAIALHLKEVLGFRFLLDLTTVDHLGEDPRFEAVYEFYSLEAGTHLRLKLRISEDDELFALDGIQLVDHPLL